MTVHCCWTAANEEKNKSGQRPRPLAVVEPVGCATDGGSGAMSIVAGNCNCASRDPIGAVLGSDSSQRLRVIQGVGEGSYQAA